ncbi:MAG: NADH-quinone oxidoreductase subunit J [Leptospira sp.]|nr:NADH-quinone oxidoreductase subunit J [Leptospira sp.]
MLELNNPTNVLFTIFAGLTIVSALSVVLHKNPVTSAVSLVLSFFSLAGIYAIMNAIFIATMQVLVYAGAIMVLVVFVLMLLSLREESNLEIWKRPLKKVVLIMFVCLFGALLIHSFFSGKPNNTMPMSGYNHPVQGSSAVTQDYSYPLGGVNGISVSGNTAVVGASTFLDYLLPFELISVLLLAAVLGAVILAKKNIGDKK